MTGEGDMDEEGLIGGSPGGGAGRAVDVVVDAGAEDVALGMDSEAADCEFI